MENARRWTQLENTTCRSELHAPSRNSRGTLCPELDGPAYGTGTHASESRSAQNLASPSLNRDVDSRVDSLPVGDILPWPPRSKSNQCPDEPSTLKFVEDLVWDDDEEDERMMLFDFGLKGACGKCADIDLMRGSKFSIDEGAPRAYDIRSLEEKNSYSIRTQMWNERFDKAKRVGNASRVAFLTRLPPLDLERAPPVVPEVVAVNGCEEW
jgi:hypothetical protein